MGGTYRESTNRIFKTPQTKLCIGFYLPLLGLDLIFNELIKRVETTQDNFTTNYETHSILFDASKYLMVKTWNEILEPQPFSPEQRTVINF
ncbi:MAG: hypothetical protein MZV64_03565 [Ignavibacteriales bacterium]|nr:hypothetical protein [Ignavibacteriales bacterium]